MACQERIRAMKSSDILILYSLLLEKFVEKSSNLDFYDNNSYQLKYTYTNCILFIIYYGIYTMRDTSCIVKN